MLLKRTAFTVASPCACASRGNARGGPAFRNCGIDQRDRAAQRIACADRLHVGEDGIVRLRVGLLHHVGEIQRLSEEIRDRLAAKQNIILNRQDFFFGEIGGRGEFHAASRKRGRRSPRFPETIAEKDG